MRKENEIIDFLRARLSHDSMMEFMRRFAGYRIPKRASCLIHEERVRIVLAVLVRTHSPADVLTEPIAQAVATENGASVGYVRSVWQAWRRTGRPRARGARGSVREATAPDSTRW